MTVETWFVGFFLLLAVRIGTDAIKHVEARKALEAAQAEADEEEGQAEASHRSRGRQRFQRSHHLRAHESATEQLELRLGCR